MMNKNWIKDAIKKPGALRKQLWVKKWATISKTKLEVASNAKWKLWKRAQRNRN